MKTKPALFAAGLALLLTACAQQNAQQGNSQADEIKQLNAKLAEKERPSWKSNTPICILSWTA